MILVTYQVIHRKYSSICILLIYIVVRINKEVVYEYNIHVWFCQNIFYKYFET